MNKPRQIIELPLDYDVAADLAVRAAKLGLETVLFCEILVLSGAYGSLHPAVMELRKRAGLGVSGTETQGEEDELK